jgi:hypothetical protein
VSLRNFDSIFTFASDTPTLFWANLCASSLDPRLFSELEALYHWPIVQLEAKLEEYDFYGLFQLSPLFDSWQLSKTDGFRATAICLLDPISAFDVMEPLAFSKPLELLKISPILPHRLDRFFSWVAIRQSIGLPVWR